MAVLELREERLRHVLDNAHHDVLFLAQTPPVPGLVRAYANNGFDALENTPLSIWERRFTSISTSYLQINPAVYLVRLIGAENNGRELIKIQRNNGVVEKAEPDYLFQKANRTFYIETTKIKQGEVYLSDINLLRVNNQLSIPYQITLRASTPIYSTDNKLFGMVVLNVDLAEEFYNLQKNILSDSQLFLLDEEGTYLIHPDKSKTFGKDLEKNFRWQLDAPPIEQADDFSLIQYSKKSYYQAHKAVELGSGTNLRHYQLVILYPESKIAEAVFKKRVNIALLLLCAEILLGFYLFLIFKSRQRDAELLAEQKKLVSIAENSGEAIVGQDLNGNITSWNSAATWMFGYAADSVLGKPLREFLVPPELHEEDIALINRAKQREALPPFRSTRLTKDGTRIRVLISISPILDMRGSVVGIAKTMRDIAAQEVMENQIINHNLLLERQVAERTQELESAYADYAQLVESAPFALIQVDAAGIIKKCNLEAVNIFGYSRSELLNTSIDQLLPESFRGKHAHLRGTYLDNPTPRRMGGNRDLFARHKSGSLFPVEIGLVTVALNNELHVIAAITDITERKKLERERNKLSQILEMTPDFIGTADMDGNLGYHNKASFDMLGIPMETDMSTMHIKNMHPEWAAKLILETAHPQLAKTGVWMGETALLHKDGHEIPVSQVIILHRDKNGEPEFISTVMRDISEQKRREQELSEARIAADAASRAKSEFIANMSHEIRTPMNAVLGMTQLMLRTPLSRQQKEYLQKSQGAAKTLLGILNDILDFSKVEAGKLNIEPHIFSLDEVLRNLGVIAASSLKGKSVEIIYDIPHDLPAQIVGDSLRLGQVLINLTSNAIKFTNEGQVVISLTITSLEDQIILIRFAVEDSGIGISPEQWKNLFKGFAQAEASTTRRYGGTGLGLVISKRLVELMGGELEGRSEYGKGTRFEFELPFTVVESYQQKEIQTPLQNKRVLLADDNSRTRETIAKIITTFGWQLELATSGNQAIELIQAAHKKQNPFDVMFIDWNMPELSGLATCQKINRELKEARPSVIIMLSQTPDDLADQKIQCDQANVDGLITKPITASMLLDAVSDVILARNLIKNTQFESEPTTQRLAGINILLVEDNELNQEVARELLVQEGAVVQIANNGLEAVELVCNSHVKIDIVLMDVQMPVMDGFEATKKIREMSQFSSLPIIAMTANAMLEDRNAALKAGMNDHIGKPFSLENLVHTLNRWVKIASKVTAEESPLLPVAEPAIAADDHLFGFDVQGTLIRLGGKPEFYLRFLKSFVGQLEASKSNFRTALNEKDNKQIYLQVHSIKGVAGTMGAVELSAYAKQLHSELQTKTGRELSHEEGNTFLTLLHEAGENALKVIEHLESTLASETLEPKQIVESSEEFVELSRMLAASDLKVVDYFQKIDIKYRGVYKEEMAQLRTLMDQLNFTGANVLCKAILQSKFKVEMNEH